MQAVILVGGEGTRLRPLTVHTPKAMVPILNRPFLEHTLEYLKRYGATDIILAMGYLPNAIKAYFHQLSDMGLSLTYVVESHPLGTAGAVKNVSPYLKSEPFFVLNGDIITDLDLGAMYAYHIQKKARATIAIAPVDDPTAYGVVETDGQGRVRRFIEKPGWDAFTTNVVNAGVYILEPEVLELMPPQTHFMFEQRLFPLLLQRDEPVYGYPFYGYWVDLGTPRKYLQLHHDLLLRLSQDGSQPVGVGEGCHVHPTAQVQGAVLLGPGCHIEAGVRLIGPAVLGPGCLVEAGATIEGAVLWSGVNVGPEAWLKNCILADNCFVGGRCWISEGCVVGEGARIGEGNRLGQATRVWPGKSLEPGTLSF